MEQPNNTTSIVDMFMHPVFRVKDTVIIEANKSALQHQVTIGDTVTTFLITGKEEYASFHGGFLSVSLGIGGVTYIAGVVRYEDGDLFHLRTNDTTPELRALALAAQSINAPLSNALTVADQFFSQESVRTDPVMRDQAALINRNLYQLMRIVKNMEAADGSGQITSFATVNIVSLISEVLDKAGSVATAAKKELSITLPHEVIYCLADEALIMRAVYNMISNAIKFSPDKSTIQVELSRSADILRFSIRNRTDRKFSDLMSTAFMRYLREPGIDDGRNGLGLGISIIQSAAAAHGGTMLLDQPDSDTVRFTMTIAIKNNKPGMLSNNITIFDYAGGYDHLLLELSDILPASEYADVN